MATHLGGGGPGAPAWRASVLLVVLVAAVGCSGHATGPLRLARGTPIVIVSIDTLRSDHLPAYGYQRVETPAIDLLRSHSVLFERAYTHVPLTLPAHTSIFSGLLPPQHGVRDNHGYELDSDRIPLLQRRLSDAGYATGGAVSAFVLRRETGIGEGFDFYDDDIDVTTTIGLQGIQRPGGETLQTVLPWLRSVADRPFYLFFHIYEPHSPYEPPEPFASRYENPYDGEVAAADAIVGSLFDELKALGVYDKALIVLLSDHGEGLGDHDESEHGILLYRSTLQVPLILKLPRSKRGGEAIHRPVELVDIYPTIISALGLKLEEGLPGSPLLDHSAEEEDRAIYSETFFPRIHCGWSDLASLIVGSQHFIHSSEPELFDLGADPAELDDLADDQPQRVKELTEKLSAYDRHFVSPGVTDAETRQRLAALGYVGEAVVTDGEDLPNPRDRVGVFQDVRRAYRDLSEGRYHEAEEAYLRILADNPGLEDAWEYLARAQQKQGRPEDALKTINTALTKNPGSPTLNMSAATLFYELGKLDDAVTHVQFAMSHDAAAAHQLLAQIALERGDLAGAETEAKTALDIENRREGPRLVLADVYRAGGRLDEAIEVLEHALDDNIRVEAVHTKLAELYLEVGDLDRAAANLAGLEDSDQSETLVLLGRLAGLRQRFGDAKFWFEKALQADPTNAEATVNLGVLAVVEGRIGEARRLLEKGVALDPRSFEGWNAIGMLRARSGDPRGAIEAWEKALEINPQVNDLLFNLGLANAQARRFNRAAEYMESFAKVASGERRRQALDLASRYRRQGGGFDLGIQ